MSPSPVACDPSIPRGSAFSCPRPCLAMGLDQHCGEPAGRWREQMAFPLRAVDDGEGLRIPAGLPEVVDGHVHLFPDGVFEAIWRWFDAYGWPIRYKLHTPEVVDFLLSRGVSRIVALHYAHKPGLARFLNDHMAGVCRREPRVIGLATVFPGEEDAVRILEDAFAAGLRGVKLHCHVQCFSPDSAEMHEIYQACARAGKPVVIHAGQEPATPALKCDPYQICAAERVERVLVDYPKLRVCVPHLGAGEFEAYERMISRYDNLWLDTTMMAADFFPIDPPLRLLRARPDRMIYGTDFPNLPYAWDREIKKLLEMDLPDDETVQMFGATANALFR